MRHFRICSSKVSYKRSMTKKKLGSKGGTCAIARMRTMLACSNCKRNRQSSPLERRPHWSAWQSRGYLHFRHCPTIQGEVASLRNVNHHWGEGNAVRGASEIEDWTRPYRCKRETGSESPRLGKRYLDLTTCSLLQLHVVRMKRIPAANFLSLVLDGESNPQRLRRRIFLTTLSIQSISDFFWAPTIDQYTVQFLVLPNHFAYEFS
jgi:hypothetical protein